MGTLTIKIPDGMEDDLDAYLENNPHYLNRSELVRDALGQMLEQPRLSADSLHRVERSEKEFEPDEFVSLEDVGALVSMGRIDISLTARDKLNSLPKGVKERIKTKLLD